MLVEHSTKILIMICSKKKITSQSKLSLEIGKILIRNHSKEKGRGKKNKTKKQKLSNICKIEITFVANQIVHVIC